MDDDKWSKYQGLINLVLGGLMAMLGWMGRTLYEEVRSLRTDHEAFKLSVAREYPTNESFQRLTDRIELQLQKILDKLDGKADRVPH